MQYIRPLLEQPSQFSKLLLIDVSLTLPFFEKLSQKRDFTYIRTVMADVTLQQPAEAALDKQFVREMLSSPLCKPTDSGVSTDTSSIASGDDHVTEIADIALDLALSSDSDDADDSPATPAPRSKFSRERPTPQAIVVPMVRLPLDVVRDVVLPSPVSSLSDAGKLSSSDPSPQPADKSTVLAENSPTCKRCDGEHFGKHAPQCAARGTFKEYATCPRCRCVSTTKKQWRYHIALCYRSSRPGIDFPAHRWEEHLTRVDKPILQEVCNHCDQWRTVHRRMLHLHKVLCSASTDRYLPELPTARSLNADTDDGELQLTYPLARTLMYAFKMKPILAAFESTAYLHDLMTKKIAERQVGGAAAAEPRAVTSTFDITALPTPTTPTASQPPRKIQRTEVAFTQGRRPNPASKRLRPSSSTDLPRHTASQAPVSVRNGEIAATHGGKLMNAAALEHCVQPTTEVHRGRKRERLVDVLHQKADQHGVPRRWCEPLDLPAKLAEIKQHSERVADVATSQNAVLPAEVVHKDRFKILRSTGLWTDAYSRPTSPPASVKARLPKPDITFRGHLTSNLMFSTPAEVTVSGHLPTGLGHFVLPDPALANDAYKTAPGDDTALPARVAAMPYVVRLYFADPSSDIAGMLITNVELSKYRRLEYRAAGITSLVRITPLVAASDD